MKKKVVTITLYLSELIYDIQNKTYLTGRSRQNGQNHEEVSNMQASDDEENLNQISRSIQNAFGTLKTKLSEYLDSNTVYSDNELLASESEDTLTVRLFMPTNYNQATVDSISAALHQYIVNVGTFDWFTITNKADAADYMVLANNNIEQIREALNKRVRPIRRCCEDNSSRFNVYDIVATPVIMQTQINEIGITTITNGATIHYTTDGSKPTVASPVFDMGLLFEPGTHTVKAMAVKEGMYNSAIASFTFTI